jgi:biopolymer transport protein ExbB
MDLLTILQISLNDTATSAPMVTNQSMPVWELLTKGGWLMIPIFLMSIVSVYIFFDRYLSIRKATKIDRNFMDRIRDYIKEDKVEDALALCRKTDSQIARMIEKGIKRIGQPMKEIEDAIEVVGKFEIYKLEKNLVILGVIAGIAPMFGFIGTIIGVIRIFYNISLADNISIGIISGGLYEKMVVSAAGLTVGIIAFICFHWLNIMVSKVVHMLEQSAMDFIDLLQEPVK